MIKLAAHSQYWRRRDQVSKFPHENPRRDGENKQIDNIGTGGFETKATFLHVQLTID